MSAGQIFTFSNLGITRLVLIANWSVFEDGKLKLIKPFSLSIDISEYCNICLSDKWDTANSPTHKNAKKASEKQDENRAVS